MSHSTPSGIPVILTTTVDAADVASHMPLTRPGLPEHLQGLFWMNQWGFREPSGTGSMDCLAKSAPDFFTQKNCPARPDLLVSFSGMPFVDVGGNHVTIVAVEPTAVPTWSWFGSLASGLSARDPATPPVAYKFVFDADWKQAVIVPSSTKDQSDQLRFVMVFEGDDKWSRRTYTTPDFSGTPIDYPVHRVVNGAGDRLAAFDDYLAFATNPLVAGDQPDKIALNVQVGATSNAELLAQLLYTPSPWPAWADDVQFPPS